MAQQIQFSKGLWQRPARHLYQDGELVEAFNVCPDEYGAVTTRPGHTVVVSGLDQTDVTGIHTAYNRSGIRRLYVHAGTKLYRDGSAIVTGLTTSFMTFANIRGNGEETLYTFAANGSAGLQVKDSGAALTQWGINPPSAAPAAATTTGDLVGTYRWRVTFLRKPVPPNVRYGSVVSGVYTDQTGGNLSVCNTTNNDGHIVGAAEPFGEIFYNISTAGFGGSPVFIFQYWDGYTFVTTTPAESPNFLNTGRTRVKFDFPTTNWRTDVFNGHTLYAIRMLASTAPTTTAAVANVVTAYDSIITCESNPSPPTPELTTATHAGAISSIPSPQTAGQVDYDLQVTHVGIYRTVANESLEDSPYLFSGEVLAGVQTYTDNLPDILLGRTLELDNARPEVFLAIAEHQNRLFGLKGNTVYPSKFQQPEAFPPQIAFDVGTLSDPPLTLWSEGGVLYVATAVRVYQIVGFGQDAGGNSLYVPQETLLPTGLGAVGSVVHGARADYLLGSDGVLWRMRGPAMAENLSDERLYSLFHGYSLNGQPALNQAARGTCVSGYYPSRFLFSYPATPATLPSTTLLYDELTDAWYRDSRGFRSFHYDRQATELFAGLTNGSVVKIAQAGGATTDAGVAIAAIVQSKDDDDGLPNSDKTLVDLIIEAQASSVTTTAVLDYGAGDVVLLGSTTHPVRTQAHLSTTANTVTGTAIGYLLTWSGPGTLYRLLPYVLRLPPRRKAYRTLVTDCGWPGPKRVEAFFVDADLVSADLTAELFGDGAVQMQATVTGGSGRFQQNLLQTLFDATLIEARFGTTGEFRLYPNTFLSWIPLPPTWYSHRTPPTDLGWSGRKVLSDIVLDLEWVTPGDITLTVRGDTFLGHEVTYQRVYTQTLPQRQRLPRERLPAEPIRLLTVQIAGTCGFRLWPGSRLTWHALGGQPGVQTFPLAESIATSLRQTPLVGTEIGG